MKLKSCRPLVRDGLFGFLRSTGEVTKLAACVVLRRLTGCFRFLGLPRCFYYSGGLKRCGDSSEYVLHRGHLRAHLQHIGLCYGLEVQIFWINLQAWCQWFRLVHKRGWRVAVACRSAWIRDSKWRWSWRPLPNVERMHPYQRGRMTVTGLRL